MVHFKKKNLKKKIEQAYEKSTNLVFFFFKNKNDHLTFSAFYFIFSPEQAESRNQNLENADSIKSGTSTVRSSSHLPLVNSLPSIPHFLTKQLEFKCLESNTNKISSLASKTCITKLKNKNEK